jgi:hypothetical protein
MTETKRLNPLLNLCPELIEKLGVAAFKTTVMKIVALSELYRFMKARPNQKLVGSEDIFHEFRLAHKLRIETDTVERYLEFLHKHRLLQKVIKRETSTLRKLGSNHYSYPPDTKEQITTEMI